MAYVMRLSWSVLIVLVLAVNLSLSHGPPARNNSSPLSPLMLHTTHTQISRGVTKNVVITCERGYHFGSTMEKLYWLRILKKTPTGWMLVAQQRDVTGTETDLNHLTVVGDLDVNSGEGYLQARWTVADESVFGVYTCDALGMKHNLQYVFKKTSELTISERNITTEDMFDLLIEKHSDMKRETEEIAEDVEENSSILKSLLDRIIKLEREMLDHTHGMDTISHNASIAWPAGQFGLLMPDVGCPADPAFHLANSSFVKFHREAHNNATCDDHNQHFHLSKPVSTATGSDCFINLRFCEAANRTSTVPWPDGSYCINWNIEFQCPPGFLSGRVVLDQVDGTQTHEVDSRVVELSGTYTYLHFCCKDTLPHEIPMLLPTDSPFYLYRFGGVCQQVQGMDVTPEYIDIDTEDRINGDSSHGNHADINIQPGAPTRVELCYYTKRS